MSTATGKSMAASPKKKIIFSLKSHRRLRAVQIYSQRYYKIRVQPAVKKAIRLSCTPLTRGQKLTLINKLTQETFKSESEEVKAEVFDALEQLREERAEASQRGERSPEEYLECVILHFPSPSIIDVSSDFLSAIDAAPTLLNRFLHDLALQTGWWFTVIAGGPDPADGGNIHTGRSVELLLSSSIKSHEYPVFTLVSMGTRNISRTNIPITQLIRRTPALVV